MTIDLNEEEALVVNLTPHRLDIRCQNGGVMVVEPSGVVARVAQEDSATGSVPVVIGLSCAACGGVVEYDEPCACGCRDSFPTFRRIRITSTTYGKVENLPAPAPGMAFVVSGMVASAVSGRNDVFSPGPLVRDDAGRVVGCEGLRACAAPAPVLTPAEMEALQFAVNSVRDSHLHPNDCAAAEAAMLRLRGVCQ